MICSRGAIVVSEGIKLLSEGVKPFVYLGDEEIEFAFEPRNFGIRPRFRRGDLGVHQVAYIAHACPRAIRRLLLRQLVAA